jgi:hypothetical protein
MVSAACAEDTANETANDTAKSNVAAGQKNGRLKSQVNSVRRMRRLVEKGYGGLGRDVCRIKVTAAIRNLWKTTRPAGMLPDVSA